ncbi:MAG: amidohydrolase [Mycobacterium leprae]
MQAEWLFSGGSVYSPHTGWQRAEAVALAGGKVIAFGRKDEVEQVAGPATRRVDLAGRTVIPGLVDAHQHILGYAKSLDLLAVAGLPSLAAMAAAVARKAAGAAPGEWVVGRGWDQDRWVEHREPTRYDLDPATPGQPVFLQRNCNHVAVVNSVALRLAGITRETPDPAGGKIDRDPASGEPTGMLRENAMDLVRRVIPKLPAARKRELLAQAMREALSYGITQVQSDDVDTFAETEALFGPLARPEAIPLRVTEMIPGAQAVTGAERGIRTGAGNEWFRYGHVKLFADGSLGARTAALLDPYSDKADTRGIYVHDADEFRELVVTSHALGNQVGCHCIGDGAAQRFIDAVAEAQRRHPRPDTRHRIIHAQILSEPIMAQLAAQQMVGDIQPVFIKSDGYWFQERVGPSRARTSYAWKSMLQHGIPLCGGSDCPIEPLNIWTGIYTAVNRQDLNGYPEGGWSPAQRLSVSEALALYTTGAAYATFEEHFKGTLAPGMAGDLLVLDRNPFTCDPAELKDVKVTMTIVGGHLAHEA